MLDIFPWFLFFLFEHIPHDIKRFPMIYHNLYWRGSNIHPPPLQFHARQRGKFENSAETDFRLGKKCVPNHVNSHLLTNSLFQKKNIFSCHFPRGGKRGRGAKKRGQVSSLTFFCSEERKNFYVKSQERQKRSRSRYKRTSFKKVSFFLSRLSGKG